MSLLHRLGLVCLGCFSIAQMAVAADLVGSGDRLRMMQKIQGKWQNRCVSFTRQPKELFTATRVVLSYTHLTVYKEIYEDSRCLRAIDVREAKYRYVLGEPIPNAKAGMAYELNLKAESPENATWHPLNLVGYQSGELYFGLWNDGENKQRLKKLDQRNPFTR